MSNWERRHIPCSPGYNQCAPSGPPTYPFNVTYDAAEDALNVELLTDIPELPNGFLDTWSFVFFFADGGVYSSPPGIWIADDKNLEVKGLSGASQELQVGDLVRMVFTAGAEYPGGQVAQWTGSVNIDPNAGSVPAVFDYSYGTYSRADGSPLDCSDPLPLYAVPRIFVYGEGLTDPSVATINVAAADGFSAQWDADGSWSDGYVVLDAANPDRYTGGGHPNIVGAGGVGVIFLLDASENIVGAPTGFAFGAIEFLEVTKAGRVAGTPTSFIAEWTESESVPSRVNITDCDTSTMLSLYDPSGPDAASNPAGSTVVKWDETGISVTGIADLATMGVYQITMRSALNTSTVAAIVGEPLADVVI